MALLRSLEPTAAEVAAAAHLPDIVPTGAGLPWTREAVVRQIAAPLKGYVRVHLDWTYGVTGSPQTFQLGGALAALAAVVPTHWTVPNVPGGEAHGNLFIMLVGSQGASRKTTALKRTRQALGAEGAVRVGDTPGSEAGLVKAITEQPDNHIVLLYPEMGDFFAFTQDRNGGNYAAVIKTKLLDLFDREPLTRRLSKTRHVAENPHVSVLGCINPRLIAQYVPASDWETGLMSRFLILWAESERNVLRTHPDPRLDWLQGFTAAALKIRPDDFGECLGLTPAAEAYWIAWMLKIEQNLPTGTAARICGPMARAPQIALRVALLLAFGEGAGWPQPGQAQGAPWYLDRPILEVAVKIATMGYQSSLLLSEHAVSDLDMRKRQEVLGAIGREWTPLGEITRAANLLRHRAVPILDTLREEGLVQKREGYGAPGVGGPSYRLAPTLDDAAADAADGRFTAAVIEKAMERHGIQAVVSPTEAAAAPPATQAPPPPVPGVVPNTDHARRPTRRIVLELPPGVVAAEAVIVGLDGSVTVLEADTPRTRTKRAPVPAPPELEPAPLHPPMTDAELTALRR